MGRYADNLKLNSEFGAIDTKLNKVNANGEIESLQEVLNLLSATSDGNTKLLEVINAAIDTKITTAIGTDGVIEAWADDRYEPKTP